MKTVKILGSILLPTFFLLLPAEFIWPDGGFVSRIEIESVAISADQRAILIWNGDEISMTLSTGYTGDGEDFGWIIPTPVAPAIEDVSEAGEDGEIAFELLEEITAPVVVTESGGGGGCFPSGTEVTTTSGPRPIETIVPGTMVHSYDLSSGGWVLKRVLQRHMHQYEGDMITIQLGQIVIQATGNHPFFVVQGEKLTSRPLPKDVPMEEQRMMGQGRWVEARDLKAGDVLLGKVGSDMVVTNLARHYENTEVYNLEVEGLHNYAVHRKGLLVHNKASAEGGEWTPVNPVTVHGTVVLEHYEASILGAANATSLLNWLQQNGYQVNLEARGVLDSYIDRNWAFVAVKLNPGEMRRYNNEYLPPLTIKYRHEELVFPLHISSVSTIGTVRITLYVFAESPVTSSNFPTSTLRYDSRPSERVDPAIYIESCILGTIANIGPRGLVVTWRGDIRGGTMTRYIHNFEKLERFERLMYMTDPSWMSRLVTRLETWMGPESMSEDIRFVHDPLGWNWFEVVLESEVRGSSSTAPIDVALRDAVRFGQVDAVRNLLEHGANVKARAWNGDTALILAAVAHGLTEASRLLLEAGADVNAKNINGNTALINAARAGSPALVSLLEEAGADVNVKNNDGNTALLLGAESGITEVIRLLLEAGADVNAKNINGNTALINAARVGNPAVVSLLLEAGADVKARDNKRKTAIGYARSNDHRSIVKLLRDARRMK